MNNLTKFNSNFFLITNFIFSCLSILLLTVPIIKAPFLGNRYTGLMAITLIGWLISAILYNHDWIRNSTKLSLQILILLGFYLFLAVFDYGNIRVSLFTILPFWYYYFVYKFYSYYQQVNKLKILVLISIISLLGTFISTTFALFNYPNITRELDKIVFSERINYLFLNIGGVEFTYAGGLCFALVLTLFVNRDSCLIINKYFNIVVLLFLVIYIYYASSGIIFLSIPLIIFFTILAKVKYNKIYFLVIIYLVLSIYIMSFPFSIGNYYVNLLDNQLISKKISDVIISLETGTITGDLLNRFEAYSISLKTIYSSLFMGVGPYYSPEDYSHGIDGHSQFLSDFARYGFMFCIYMAVIFNNYYKILKTQWLKYNLNSSPFLPVTIFLFYYLFNPIGNPIGMFIFIILPGISLFSKSVDNLTK